MGACNVAMTLVSLVLIEKAGRKTLMLTGLSVMLVTTTMILICLNVKVSKQEDQVRYSECFSTDFLGSINFRNLIDLNQQTALGRDFAIGELPLMNLFDITQRKKHHAFMQTFFCAHHKSHLHYSIALSRLLTFPSLAPNEFPILNSAVNSICDFHFPIVHC